MLIHYRAVQVQRLPVQHRAGIAHRHGQRHPFRQSHIVEKDGHRQRGDLPFRHGVITHAVDKEADLFFAQGVSVTFFSNYFLW